MRPFRQRLTLRAAARILDRPGTAGSDALGLLLAAASAPSRADQRGEDLAVADFRAATHLDQAPTTEGEPLMIKTVRRMMAAPVAALGAAALVLGGGGIALAASQGALNVPFSGHDNRSDKAPAAPATTNPGLTHAATAGPATPESTATHTPSATPSPSLSGLCHAFQAGAADVNHSNPAFDALTAAAGGEANVAAYCTGLIGPATGPTHPAKPTQAATPTHPAKPTQAATPAHRAMPTQAASPTQRSTRGTH